MERYSDKNAIGTVLRELRPAPRPEFVAELDARAADGFREDDLRLTSIGELGRPGCAVALAVPCARRRPPARCRRRGDHRRPGRPRPAPPSDPLRLAHVPRLAQDPP